MKELYSKYKTIILYVFFGGLTTVVNIASFTLLSRILSFETTVPANAVAWFLSVMFAFITNKYFVFDAGDTTKKGTLFQLINFFAARAFSGVLDILVVYILVDALSFPQLPVKFLSNVLVIILNYAASKLFIFK